MSRLQTGTDWLFFLALCAFTTPIGGIMKCQRLFRPLFRKFNPSFVTRIP